MFAKVNVPVLGVVENMAGFVTPTGEKIDIFGAGGGEALASQYNIPFLGSIPIDVSIREGGDKGVPVAIEQDSIYGKVFTDIATRVLEVAQIKAGEAPTLKVVN